MTSLTTAEAERRSVRYGSNTIPDTDNSRFRQVLGKLAAPVPCMLEATVVLEVVLGKYVEAAIIAALVTFNAALGYFQESRARDTLQALKKRLSPNASVERDGRWQSIGADRLVPGDLVRLSLGAVVAADVRIVDGNVLLDQSMLTGESLPVEAGAGVTTYAGTLVRRGEATAEVTATGANTKFGQSAALVRTAHVVSSQQKAVFHVVRNLAACNGVVILAMLTYAQHVGTPIADMISMGLTAVLASIPVALPATFTLAAALGARTLARIGVLSTRLSAVDEAASMDVLCVDKTGTLTRNALSVVRVVACDGVDEGQVLLYASLASSDAGQDPVDAAIRTAAASRSQQVSIRRTAFLPFDPVTKRSEGSFFEPGGTIGRAVKGAPPVVFSLVPPPAAIAQATRALEDQGYRVLAVAAGASADFRVIGLIALSDPPRKDSASLIRDLSALGVRTVMITGDAAATARSVANAVGLTGAAFPPGAVPETLRPDTFAVFAGVLPQDKYSIVKAFQKGGHTVGMCGDGANDAPALRQAQIGIAVSTATDVAKSAAGMVLTDGGLGGIVAAVREGRLIFQRILTYVLNSMTKKIAQVLFLAGGLLMTGHAILTPLLMVVIMITGDFLGMSLTTDRVRASACPNAWRMRSLTLAGAMMGIGELIFCLSVLAFGNYVLHLDLGGLQTLAFVVIVFGNQATTYNNRERRHLWSSRPGDWVLVSSIADLVIAIVLATLGIAMTPLPAPLVAGVLATAALFAVLIDLVKVPAFDHLGIATQNS